MPRLRYRLARELIALGLLLSLPGCPALMSDDFDIVDPDSSTAGSAGVHGDASAGTSGNAGSGGSDASAGSAGSSGSAGNDAGGVAGTSGTAGVSGSSGAPSDAGSDVNQSDGGDPCATCPASCCDGKCVDLLHDPEHCGACGKGCPGTVCSNGSCVNECLFSYLDCDHNVATGCEAHATIDGENCGSCGIACGFDATCVAGKCQCPANTANCDGNQSNGCETDLSGDKSNCGACNQSCGPNQNCAAGKCACSPDYADCNGKPDDGCETWLADPRTCGSCSHDCGPNTTCNAGTCGCTSDFLDCTTEPGCESAKTSASHCGACSEQCQGSTPVCNGTACVGACTTGQTPCGDSCVDLATDPTNCGACGKPVGQNQECTAGKPTCLPNFADCNGLPGDGCEVDTRNDAGHCGRCDIACKPGALCTASACGCSASKPNDCGADCRECCNDGQCSDGNACTEDHCSAQGTCQLSAPCAGGEKCCGGAGCFECCNNLDCSGGQVCSGNKCVTPACSSPLVLCDGQCVNIDLDANHCGGCNHACTGSRSCSGQVCGPKWLPSEPPPATFVARSRAAFTRVGSRAFIWGGSNATSADLNTGAFYDPALSGSAAWSLIAVDSNTPEPRVHATAVWTGTAVLIWGGGNRAGTTDYKNGALYDPVSGTWRVMSEKGGPGPRRGALGVWTGSRALIWGGFTKNGGAASGAYLYDPQNDVWTGAARSNDPGALLDPATAWSGSELFVASGSTGLFQKSDVTSYRPATDSWVSLLSGPSAREGAFGAWDGNNFVVWGGRASSGVATSNGQRYDTSTGAWSTMATAGEPSDRYAVNREHGWTAQISSGNVLVLGGFDPSVSRSDTAARKDGAIYNALTNTWAAVPAWPSGQAHRFGVAVWMGTEFLVWGGEAGGAPTNAGERFLP